MANPNSDCAKRWRKKNPVKATLYKIRWYTRHHHEWDKQRRKHRCNCITCNAIRYGILARPLHCQGCGTKCKPNAHHEDYARILDVQFYCRKCHNAADRAREERLGIVRQPPAHRYVPMKTYNRALRLWATGKYSQVAIGKRLGIANSTVSNWVRGLKMPRR